MYRNNINLSLTFLGLFLIENVLGAPGDSSLAKNHGELKIFCGTHCSRIARYPSFISQDFFHFSSFIHYGDNLNM